MSVLVIEDDPYDFEYLKWNVDELSEYHFDLMRVESQEAACAALDQVNFDLAICDFWLKDHTSIAALKFLANRMNHIPIILVSSLDAPSIKEIAFSAGASVFLAKSAISPMTLESALSTALHPGRLETKMVRGVTNNDIDAQKVRELSNFIHTPKTDLTDVDNIISHDALLNKKLSAQFNNIHKGETKCIGEKQKRKSPIDAQYCDLRRLIESILELRLHYLSADQPLKVALQPLDLPVVIRSNEEILSAVISSLILFMKVRSNPNSEINIILGFHDGNASIEFRNSNGHLLERDVCGEHSFGRRRTMCLSSIEHWLASIEGVLEIDAINRGYSVIIYLPKDLLHSNV